MTLMVIRVYTEADLFASVKEIEKENFDLLNSLPSGESYLDSSMTLTTIAGTTFSFGVPGPTL